MKQINITPLSEFPTEVLVYNFKRLRTCRTYRRCGKQIGVEKHWVPHQKYDKEQGWVEDYYTLYEYPIYESEKYTITSGPWGQNKFRITFEGKYWEGDIKDLLNEINSRPHCNIHGSKDFRKWKINYKKK